MGPMATSHVSAQYVDAFTGLLERCGLPREHTRDHLSPLHCNNVLGRVSAGRFSDLVHWGTRELNDPAIGLRFGHSIGGRGFGLLGIATASADTLAGAIRCLANMESLTSTLGQLVVVREGNVVHLRWQTHEHALHPALVEGIIAGWASFGRFVIGQQAPIVAASFRHAPTTKISTYEDVFASNVRFGAEWDGLSIAAELLDAKTQFGDAELNRALWSWSNDSTLVARSEPNSLVRRVVDAIGARLPQQVASEDEIARELGTSRRSLQRNLQELDLSYRRLLDCVRGKLAIGAVMEGPSSFMQVAEHIGYAEQASFCHSFRRWAGVTPSEFVRKFPPSFFDSREPNESMQSTRRT